jgi:DNA-binding MurR/RpiR family transcriptional regulator
MTALAKLRTERGRMSAMDRRIADYILANAQLLRDYSSQQLADALKVSQSSVVKFSQRLGYKGYPDLKISITEAIARATAGEPPPGVVVDSDTSREEALWRGKAVATRETRLLNPSDAMAAASRWLGTAETLFVGGEGIDGDAAHTFASRIALLGHRAIVHRQPHDLLASLSAATERDALLVICGHGDGGDWLRPCQAMKHAGGKVVVVSRRAERCAPAVDVALVVSAHDPQPHVEDLLYESAARHLLDDLFLRVAGSDPTLLDTFAVNRRRMHATGE